MRNSVVMAALVTLLALTTGSGVGDAQAEQSQPVPKPADADARAKQLYVQADQAYAEGKYSLSLALFRESYALSQRPLILVAMANSQERLGDLQGALDSLRTYAAQADLSKEPTIEQRILALQTRVEKAEQEKAAQEKAAQEKAAQEKAAQEKAAQEKAAQEKAAQEKAAQINPAQAPPVGSMTSGSETIDTAQSPWPWIAVGGGSAAVVAGLSFALVARSARAKTDSLCRETNGDLLCLPGAKKYLDRDSNFSLLADLSIGVGVASIATGLLFLLLPDNDEGNPGPSLTIAPDGASLSFESSF